MNFKVKNKFIGNRRFHISKLRFAIKITSFFKDVRLELKKVNWPTRNETLKYTFIVIGASVAVAVFLGGLDFIFSFLLNKFIIR